MFFWQNILYCILIDLKSCISIIHFYDTHCYVHLLQDVEKAQEDQDAAKRSLDEVTTTFLQEFETFKTDKASDIKSLLLKLCQLDVEFHRKYVQEQDGLVAKIQEAI